MKKKIVWLVVTGWMVAALLLASCAPAVVKEEAEKVAPPVEKEEVVVPKEVVAPKPGANLVKWTKTKRDGTVFETMLEKPKYGGKYIYATDVQPNVFDSIVDASAWASEPVVERLAIQHDWTRGPAGTAELLMVQHTDNPFSFTPTLATGYEILDDSTIIYHIRQGVHWQDKAPMNGREFTADDVVFDYIRHFTPGAYGAGRGPLLSDPANPKNSIYISPTNKWDVVMKTKPGMVASVFMSAACHRSIHPPEVIQKYKDMNDWKNVVGTGPFILTEYVGASSLTYIRNPDYWEKDPFFGEDQLPYIDTLKVLIIPDISTRIAAMRTGKIDSLYDLDVQDAEPLLKSNPELRSLKHGGANQLTLNMRNDKPELPFYDVRVRRALSMAINRLELRDVYYGGKADLLQWPVYPVPEWSDIYVPFEQLPASTKEVLEYHPDKAKQLLAEAGYPQGFKTEAIAWSTTQIDLLQIVKEYWAKIGVDLKIDVKDQTTWALMGNRKTYTQMNMGSMTSASMYSMTYFRKGSVPNHSMVNDPKMEQLYLELIPVLTDRKKWTQMFKDTIPYIYEQAWFMLLPTPQQYNIWQPWLKNYEGSRQSHVATFWWPKYVWIDQELKAAMGR